MNDCTKNDLLNFKGCQSDPKIIQDTFHVWEWAETNAITTEENYPYTGTDGDCNGTANSTGFVMVDSFLVTLANNAIFFK